MDRAQFLARKSKVKPITLPDGTPAFIRKLSAGEIEHATKTYAAADKQLEGNRFAVCKGLVDEQGNRILQDGDMAALADMEFDDVNAIATEIATFSRGEVDAKKS